MPNGTRDSPKIYQATVNALDGRTGLILLCILSDSRLDKIWTAHRTD